MPPHQDQIIRDERLREAVELSLALVLTGLVLGALLVFIAFIPMVFSGGHGGNYFLAKIALPFGMLGNLHFSEPSAILLSLIQFPAYGVVLGVAHYLGWFRRTVVVLALSHATAVCLCFAVLTEFS